ncbi:MAG: class I SAM-dependent methyltransferase [Thermodesulfobacteriota bacterium]
MTNGEIFRKEPIRFHDNIPVFSHLNEYTDNYRKISEDHLESLRRNGTNPFIPEDLWLEFEKSTIELIKKYSKQGNRVLDVGVGLGRLLSQFPHLERYGIDISFGYLQVAQSKGINVCYALVEDMPYREGLFDLVVCTDVLEHVLDLNLCCARILSVLKKGGILIIRVPFRENLSQYLEVTYPYRYVHLRNFDVYSLRLLFERIFGCEYIEMATAGYTPGTNRLRYPVPFQKVNVIACRFVSGIKTVYKPAYELLLKKLYDPIVINIVVRKGKQTGRFI